MDVVITPAAREFIRAHSGAVFIRSHTHRCCSGPLTVLDTSMTEPPDGKGYIQIKAADGVDVWYWGNPVASPHVLTVGLRGIARRHLVSYWDGCVYDLNGEYRSHGRPMDVCGPTTRRSRHDAG